MTHEPFDTETKPVINLSGPEGNDFVLIGYARRLGEQLGYDKTAIDDIISEMEYGDYETLLQVFDRAFGDHVIMVR